ncbi:RNA methyltransferase, TrmH family [Bacteroides fluxus YIT 12057]|mgnify:CR=1 FL=1|jgi:tRNA G18 (ribose-2'-O)-methylase SpoU|uniref:RNA methyltransferase, TrmH family n=3 Tax=root TaxID=1 RepID=F3PVG7_9BACE|nr:RNA methyltransferase, TrmH family [Bacteroides fluxus YIT 12057]
MQGLFLKIFPVGIDTFSTVINRDINGKKYLCNLNHRLSSVMRKLKITELNRISVEEFKEARKLPLVIVLDNIRSLHNIGSVFRTSDAFRIECIYLCGITATPPHPEMHKTALGAEFTVDWKYVNNSVEAVDNLKKEGYVVYSVEQAEGSIMLDELTLDKTKKYAIVMGNEVKGVQQEVIDHSHGCIEIPQYGTKHSLNVSVTAGIVIWDLFKKLRY